MTRVSPGRAAAAAVAAVVVTELHAVPLTSTRRHAMHQHGSLIDDHHDAALASSRGRNRH